ncbi:hypothetical protein [Methyloceanibacter caenitepidi]|uniref:Tat pathway signal sequence domain protein n=1 Tax=Methyloceanibacter caenitepidi TaxID=1384459 RepID=A0A0A8K7S2_9HYPH|nr:hypothetical protein [Methyloceanibacter caenitepidi]BAQ18592.1 hypothetical protein GL4_3161 [Methyloceanibacter caenitepidi]
MLFLTRDNRHAATCTRQILVAVLALAAALLIRPAIATAEEDAVAAAEEATSADTKQASVAIELNKLEPKGSDCRAYFVIDNKSDKAYETLKLDFILFRPDGIIDQRFAVELAPLKAKKRTVKLFDVASTSCDDVGSFLINDVMECKAGSQDVADCLGDLALSSRTDNALNK